MKQRKSELSYFYAKLLLNVEIYKYKIHIFTYYFCMKNQRQWRVEICKINGWMNR